MRHSLRLDNELDNKSLEEEQKYSKDKTSYNPPLANYRYTDPPLDFIENRADDKIRDSIEALKRTKIKFNCIVTSPFTRCLQTTELVKDLLRIDIQNVFINYNIREVDLQLQKFDIFKEEEGIFNTITPYDNLLIERLNYKIDDYKIQSVNDIFNDKKKYGNVLLITHGDIFNGYIRKDEGIGIGIGAIQEAGWGVFRCPNGKCPNAGTNDPIYNHEFEQITGF